MTVAELRAHLAALPDTAFVLVWDFRSSDYASAAHVEATTIDASQVDPSLSATYVTIESEVVGQFAQPSHCRKVTCE